MSIDRRSFVQTAAAAVGGGVSFAGDAAAEERLQLAQAPTPPPASARLVAYPTPGPGAWKPPYPEKEGEQSQRYYNFLKKLFVPDNVFRDSIWGMTERQLKEYMANELALPIPDDYFNTEGERIKIMIVDIEKGRVKFADNQDCGVDGCKVTDPKKVTWYTLVLPPLPLEYKDAAGKPQYGYLREMTLEAAWHHAVVYGYGM